MLRLNELIVKRWLKKHDGGSFFLVLKGYRLDAIINKMKKHLICLALFTAAIQLFAQSDVTRIAPGAESQLTSLLNTPAMVKPATAEPLGRNWFRLETDAHVFSDQVTVAQVRAVLLDIDNQDKYYNGKRSKTLVKVVSRNQEETIADFISIWIVPILGLQIRTPYRASVTVGEDTDTRFLIEARQLSDNSATNKNIKYLYVARFAEEVTINGRKYTYIRMYTIDEVNASILPRAKSVLESNSIPISEEAIQMIIAAAKTK